MFLAFSENRELKPQDLTLVLEESIPLSATMKSRLKPQRMGPHPRPPRFVRHPPHRLFRDLSNNPKLGTKFNFAVAVKVGEFSIQGFGALQALRLRRRM